MNGLLLLDKPKGPTSFDMIRLARRVLKTRKIGHTGTLDPDASGLLPIAVGQATKFAQYLQLDDKTYTFELVLGQQTDTDDATGAVVFEANPNAVSKSDIEGLLPSFLGDVMQVPPRYSAIHVNGRRAYDLAREGVEFELPPRPVRIDEIELHELQDGVAKMKVSCGSGTYVRSIARDIGDYFGVGGHARDIRRTRVGAFSIEEAISATDFEAGAFDDDQILPLGRMVDGMPTQVATESEVQKMRFGQLLPVKVDHGETVAVINESHELIGVAIVVERESGRWLQPKKVVAVVESAT